MALYDFRCDSCALVLENAVMTFDEMKEARCPICDEPLAYIPGRFKFDVKDSRVKRRQTLERRFKKRARRIDREYTPEQKERFESWCDKHGCRKRY